MQTRHVWTLNLHVQRSSRTPSPPEEVGTLHIFRQMKVGLEVLWKLTTHERHGCIITVEPHLETTSKHHSHCSESPTQNNLKGCKHLHAQPLYHVQQLLLGVSLCQKTGALTGMPVMYSSCMQAQPGGDWKHRSISLPARFRR